MASPPPASTSEVSAAAVPKSRASYGKGERKRTFHSSHARKFALEVVARDEASGAPTAAVCLFCRHFGREERAGKKRKATANFKYFRNSFRTDLYVQHHQSQHPRQWARYSNCTDEAKRSFFPADATRPAADKQALVKTQDIAEAAAAARASPAESRCWFVLPKRVVDVVTPGGAAGTGAEGEQTWQPSAFRACDLVALAVTTRSGAGGQEDVHERPASSQTGPNGASGATEKYYRVALFGRMELDVAVDSLAVGLSPRQAARHLHALARRTTGAGGALPSLPLCSAAEMCDLARLAVSESLQLAGQLLTRCWGFGLVLREVTAAPTLSQAGYLDVRVVVYAQGRLRDVHVVALPLFERHAAFALVQTVESVLTAIFPPWRTRLLGISQDGFAVPGPTAAASSSGQSVPTTSSASTSRQRSAELLALLETYVQPPTSTIPTPQRVLYRTWGACRQVSLALGAFYEALLGGGFLPMLRALTAYIRRDPVLVQEMGHPPSVSNSNSSAGEFGEVTVDLDSDASNLKRWLTMGLDTQWITDKRVRLRKHLEQETAAVATAPIDDVWWVAFFVMNWVAMRSNEALRKLLVARASRAQQAACIAELTAELMAAFHIEHEQQPEGQELPYFSRQGKFSILKSSVHEFLGDLGIFVTNVAARVSPTALDVVLENLAICLVNLVESLTELSVSAAPETAEDSELLALPPVLPHELAQLGGRDFASLLQRHGAQLRAFFSDEELDSVEQEHQALRRAATRGTDLKAALAQCTEESSFAETWALTEDRFPLLQAFAGGLASSYAARDAGVLGKRLIGLSLSGDEESGVDGLRLPIADFALEATLHAQQFDALSELCQTHETLTDATTAISI